MEATMTAARWTNGILGLWLALAAFLGFTAFGNAVNVVTVGAVVAGIGIAMIDDIKWQGWTTTLAGLWLIIAAFIPALQTGDGLIWNSVLVGAALVVVSFPFGRTRATGRPIREFETERPSLQVEEPTPTPAQEDGRRKRPEEERELVHH
jgi:uncharacterized membrane protein